MLVKFSELMKNKRTLNLAQTYTHQKKKCSQKNRKEQILTIRIKFENLHFNLKFFMILKFIKKQATKKNLI